MNYKLTTSSNMILRLTDVAFIPTDPGSADYQAYMAWLVAGNTPQPA